MYNIHWNWINVTYSLIFKRNNFLINLSITGQSIRKQIELG